MTAPLMPKATAVWLVENTTLTFKQIADFCELHELEIQAIADGDIAYNILGVSPVANGQLSEEEIKRCEADEKAVPNAILWIIKNCPEVIDSQICKLIGTTKPTIASIREGTHGNMANLRPVNPMAVGLCSEKELEKAMLISQQQAELKESRGKKKSKKKTAKKAVQQAETAATAPKKRGRPKKDAAEKTAAKGKSAKKTKETAADVKAE